MKQDRLTTGLLAALGVLVLFASGCEKGDPVGAPTAVVTPSPSPTPSDSDARSCKQRDLLLYVYNGAGNPDTVHDFREYVPAEAKPVNGAGSLLEPVCYAAPDNVTRVFGWDLSGPSCFKLGNTTSSVIQFKCYDPGNVQLVVTHGNFKAVWQGLLIRSRDGAIVLGRGSVVRR